MGDSADPRDVDRARTFWSEQDVDQVFSGVSVYLDHLKGVLRRNTATDKECVQAIRLLDLLDFSSPASPQDQDSSVVQVVIGADELLPFNGPCSSSAPPADREELLPPLTPVQLQYHLHSCCKACLPGLPSMPQCMPAFWGENPLKVPLLCGFKRLSGVPLMSLFEVGVAADDIDVEDDRFVDGWDVIYKTPCGQSLRNHGDVMRFLLASESYDILQVDFFTFDPSVRLDPPAAGGPQRPELDLSRGAEPTPVELCVGDAGARPADFRYRKDRWPHGCFLGRGPALFDVCCDCSDGCADSERCACVAMTTGGRHYSHHRLLEPVPTGLYECGPWCGCDRARCQNRLVQRGIRVRLQVFYTGDRGWGVRCRDDLDHGTFVCIYAGVVLQRVQSPPAELPPPKLTRADLPSDDEVEVVTEWLAPPVLEGRNSLLEASPPTSPPLHVPVIQRPGDATVTDRNQVQTVLVGGPQPTTPSAGDHPQEAQRETVATATAVQGVNGTSASGQRSLKRAAQMEDVCFLDGSREGNVSRFLNHSCQPNLFVQNVFTDSHDPGFPIVSFFTNRVIKAGTELTWNYSDDTQTASLLKQEVPCLCGSNGCQGRFGIEDNLCDMWEVGGHAAMEAR
ncbi:histone-lysine N-methyltransferase SETDB2 isoform X1 [Brachyistius frenatus]|uniref:histone-lysine N-methyltransferase SETDB2 isoform X1 n=1 Tax=Brachyistius frenatus TaxID=100188 RepID=UPI0037E9332C